jgi:hypothetical protein
LVGCWENTVLKLKILHRAVSTGVKLVDDILAVLDGHILEVVSLQEPKEFLRRNVVIFVQVDGIKEGLGIEISNLRKILSQTFNLETKN